MLKLDDVGRGDATYAVMHCWRRRGEGSGLVASRTVAERSKHLQGGAQCVAFGCWAVRMLDAAPQLYDCRQWKCSVLPVPWMQKRWRARSRAAW